MLVKFEIKSNRVKGLCFHSKRPWIVVSMTTGVIQLWDHRMGFLVGDFRQHCGPVRSVHFHTSQPLFVSGGDDFKIKVWNYEWHQCLFTLLGHHDYIRTVQFHHEAPWILSASDDHTIRIWNWQSRTCISVLNGHSHYVMCASFHPKEDIVVSASLDQTIRVWDIGALRKKSTVSPADDILELSQMNPDFFGGVDAVVNYVLEGHDRGVTWVSFHPTLPWIVSCADDRKVNVWHMEDKKVIHTMKGHMNNVSCVLFHARQNIIVSNSEDKSIRVWDATKGTALMKYEKKHDKFWILAAHPEMNLLAAGHDSGMIVYKLERERPAFSVSANSLVYVKGRFLCVFEYSTQKDTQLIPIRQPDFNKLNQAPRILSHSPAESAVLVCSDTDGGSYELYIITKDSYGRGDAVQDAKKGTGGSAVFIARNRFAVLERSTNKVLIKNLTNDVVKISVLPVATNAIFYAGKGNLLCRSENEVVIFDPQQMIVLGDLQTSFVVRFVVWSPDLKSVALLGLHTIVLADKNLVQLCNRHETMRVKSGAWDDNGVFIYTTLTHIKYCLPNGESGIIKTLDAPVYVTKIYGSTIFCLDRDGISRPIVIDSTEYIFKLSLLRKRYDQVMSMIMNSELCGQAMIAYLKKKGFPQAALHFERSRCNLALKSGNIEKALELGKKINEKDYWYRLGVDSLWQGNAGIVEYAYQKTRNFERLSFHYLITGNLEKLSKMMKIAEEKNEVMGQFHDALYLGDVQERVKILENAGHLPLAYATASLHGLHDIAERLASNLGENLPSLPEGKKASLLIPPSPVLCAGDWPLLRVSEDIFEGELDEAGRDVDEDYEEAVDADYEDPFDADLGEALDTGEVDDMENEDIAVVAEEAVKHEGNDKVGGWDHEDLDLPPEMPEADSNACSSVFVAPSPGMPVIQFWVQRSSLAAEHAAAGNFEIAMHLLYRQLGIRNFSPLRTQFIDLHMGSHTYLPDCTSAPVASVALERGESASPNVGGHPALSSNYSRLGEKATGGYMATTGHLGIRNIQPWGTQFTDPHMGSHTHLPDYTSAPGASVASPNVGGHPALSTKFSRLDEKVTGGYMATTDGKFSDALGYFMSIMHTIPLIVVETMEEVDKVKELVITIKEYVLGLKMELKRRELKDDPVRQQELAAYFTHCNLQPLHTRLALLNAMSVCYKAQNLRSAANFAQRLLETKPSDEYQDRMARQVVQAAGARSMHDATELNYDFRSPFVVCGATFVPIYRGQKYVTCPYCTAQFVPSQQGQICAVCELAEIGSEGSGLMCSHSQIT